MDLVNPVLCISYLMMKYLIWATLNLHFDACTWMGHEPVGIILTVVP
uniref:Uncharacterized protein n=1 Tax=Rhizophora mucronata TaxID=61149 RepID=A0A2P2QWQ8_RHIMU